LAGKRWFRRADPRPTCARLAPRVQVNPCEAAERARAMSEPSALSESEPSALSESELIARGTNPFMEAWKRAANSFVAPAMDEDALPRSEDELEEELGAIQPFNPLDYKQRPARWRCRWFHGKKSWCFKPRECRKCSRRLSELQDRLERQREEVRRKYVLLEGWKQMIVDEGSP